MWIVEDTRQQAGKHELKHRHFLARNDKLVRCMLPVGDYALPPKVAVDTKADMTEIAGNIGGSTEEHNRFKRELIRARDMGTKLVILVENEDGITSVPDVAQWKNPRRYFSPKAIDGARLSKAMATMEDRYGCKFAFCHPNEAAATIARILEQNNEGD